MYLPFPLSPPLPRRRSHLLVNLFALMIPAAMPELTRLTQIRCAAPLLFRPLSFSPLLSSALLSTALLCSLISFLIIPSSLPLSSLLSFPTGNTAFAAAAAAAAADAADAAAAAAAAAAADAADDDDARYLQEMLSLELTDAEAAEKVGLRDPCFSLFSLSFSPSLLLSSRLLSLCLLSSSALLASSLLVSPLSSPQHQLTRPSAHSHTSTRPHASAISPALAQFVKEIKKCLATVTRQIDNWLHNLKHY